MSKEKITSFLKKIENNRFLVQGTGGNVSWKDNSTMWIKASGKSLKNSTNEEIFVPIDLNGNEINKKDTFKLRPSIETSMHKVLPYKYVIHLHSVEHIACSSSDFYHMHTLNNQIIFRVPYSKPGQLLANNIKEIIESEVIPKDTIFFILNNHGILIGLNYLNDFDNVFNSLKLELKLCSTYQKVQKKLISKKYINCAHKYKCVPKFDKKDFKYIKNSVRFCPDNIVFIDTIIPVLENHQNIDSFNNNLIYIKDFGFFSLTNANKNVEEQIQFYFDVISLVGNIKNLNVLNDDQVNDIINWDAEKYRKKLVN